MARIRDFRPVLLRVGVIGFARRVWQQCKEDNIFTWASALAYSWLFAIFPFFVFLLALVPLLPDSRKTELQNDMGPWLQKVLPNDAYKTVWEDYLSKRLPIILNSQPKGFLSMGLL